MSSERFGMVSAQEEDEQTLVLPLILSVLGLLALGLTLVWLNLERTKLAYRLNILQKDLRIHTEYQTKVVIERDHLLSPAELGKKAVALGLHVAKPGQLRRLDGARNAPVKQ